MLAGTPILGLYDRPVLVVDAGMHTARITRADVDGVGRYVVTGSHDKTVRIWSAATGGLLRKIRLPAGPGDVGKVHGVAIDPDGDIVAAGGWTRSTDADPQEQIYIFDRATGGVRGRIEGLPEAVLHLAFSPDGQRLVALLGGNGLRVFDRAAGWAECARDEAYADASYGAAFADDGRLATTSRDGVIRLYDAQFRRIAEIVAPEGREPLGIAFRPDGKRLAVGYYDTPKISLLDGCTLAPLSGPDTGGIDNGDLSKVAWSADGTTLFAGGRYASSLSPVVAWAEAGAGPRRALAACEDTIMALRPLPGGDLLVAAGDPYLARHGEKGEARWQRKRPIADFRGQDHTLAISADGLTVDFGYEFSGAAPARFDLGRRQLKPDPPDDSLTTPPLWEGLAIAGWRGTTAPTLAHAPLPLERYERSRSLALAHKKQSFVIGTEWNLRAYSAAGALLWRRPTPGVVWAVNVTADGRLVVAAYGDGTIRWHQLSDGKELLAFLPLADRSNWVAWSPEGLYAATPGARGVLRWQVNHGWDEPTVEIPVHEIPEQHRPDVLPLIVRELDHVLALGLVEDQRIRAAVRRRTGNDPAAKLHVLTVGVGEFKEEEAQYLRLRFAETDARDIAAALMDTQLSLYADVTLQTLPLPGAPATKSAILGAFAAIKRATALAPGRDTVVIHFSGHGALVEGQLYLLPHEVNPRTSYELKSSALSFADLRNELVDVAKQGRVLVLLDACHSGTATMEGTRVSLDALMAKAALAARNVTILTSSGAADPSFEDEKWQNGAFTEAFLDSLRAHADMDKDGLLTVGDVERHVARALPELTQGRQHLGIEKRFEGTIFVAGL